MDRERCIMNAHHDNLRKKTRPQCGLIIENAEGKILLQLRDDVPGIPYPNCWGTFGGQVEELETPTQALKREIMEELNYAVRHPEFFGIYPCDGYDIYMFREKNELITLDHLTVREGQRAAFLSRDDMNKIPCAFNCRDIVEDYFRKFHSRGEPAP